MNLRQLEMLRAVIRCETTMGAARELALSQPAVSNAIKHMEMQLGFPLFDRINNRLFPTPEARALYEESEPIFQMHTSLTSRIQDMKERRTGHLRISATPPLAHAAVPKALQRFMARHQQVRAHIDIGDAQKVIESVQNGVAELGFVLATPRTPPSLQSEALMQSRMVCVLRPEHVLARNEVIRPEDLRNTAVIALARDTRFGKAVRQAFMMTGEVLNYAVEVRYCNAACVLAQSGIGVAIVDPFSALCAESADLVVRPFEPETTVTAYVIFSERQPVSRLAKFFIEEVRRALLAAEPVAPPMSLVA